MECGCWNRTTSPAKRPDIHACQGDGFSSSCAAKKKAIKRQFRTRNAVSESENIVVETAEKIFADLADAQEINRDKKGAWKAPLWQALTDAGMPLSWVSEEFGGSGASVAEGFGVLG